MGFTKSKILFLNSISEIVFFLGFSSLCFGVEKSDKEHVNMGRWPYQFSKPKGSIHQFHGQSKNSPFKNFSLRFNKHNPHSKNPKSKGDEATLKPIPIQEEKKINNFPNEIYQLGNSRVIYQGEHVSAKHLYFGGGKTHDLFQLCGKQFNL